MLSFLGPKSFRGRKFISFLCVLSIALSLALFLMVEKVRNGIEEGFTNSISNADLIVGARSGPLQLLLYSIFHIGQPTNNIRYSTYEEIKSSPVVDWAIPISLGDSYKGHRVVATDKNFFDHYQFFGDQKLSLLEGTWSEGIFGVVLGATVAKKLAHKISDKVILSHGISDQSMFGHEHTPFTVEGILKRTGTPLDKSVFISLKGMEAIHLGWENGAPTIDGQIDYSALTDAHLKTEQITSFILRTKNRIALLGLQRYLATYDKEPLSAIIPALTLAELWGLLDQLEQAFLGISLFVIIIGLMSIVISLYMSLNERRHEIAILRSIGVSSSQITKLLLFEASLLSVCGAITGFVLQYLIMLMLGPILESEYSLMIPIVAPSMRELVVMGIFIGLGILAGLIPAIKAYKTSLHGGLLIK